MLRAAVIHLRNVRLHHFPNLVGNGDAVAVEIHGERRDDVCLCAKADRGRKRLAGQHMGAIQFSCYDPIKQNFPVCLRLQGHEEAFFFKIA